MASPREPILNWPIVICLIILGAFAWAFRSTLASIRDTYGFTTGMMACGTIIAISIVAAFAYDRFQGRHSRQLPQPKQSVRLPPEM